MGRQFVHPTKKRGKVMTSYAEASAPRSQKATTILVLGIISLICCQLLGPVAWALGSTELKRIRAGQVSVHDEGVTKAGMILGIISSIFLILALGWMLLFGGLAFIGALLDQSGF